MAANGKPKQYNQIAGAVVDSATEAVIRQFAREDERPLAYVIRKLIEESPRVKAALRKSVRK